MEKEFLYVGHYIDTDGNYILKVGTTDDLERRRSEHNRNYRKAASHTLAALSTFDYDFTLPLSKYNTLRYEDKTRELWKSLEIGEFIRNDRFVLKSIPENVYIIVRKMYVIPLKMSAS